MTWDKTMVTTLRVLINDTDDCPTYTDTRLRQMIVVAAEYTQMEIDFTTTYAINIDSPNIAPDPVVENTTNSIEFWTISVMKAACIVDQSNYRTKAAISGIEAKCGPAVLKTALHIKGFRDLIDFGPCAAYESLKTEYEFGNSPVGHAVLSPFISNNFDPEHLHSSFHRDN